MDKKEFFFSWLVLLALSLFGENVAAQKKGERLPWENGRLVVSEEGRYLKHENGTPFFWLGETGWLLPECLNREEADYYVGRTEYESPEVDPEVLIEKTKPLVIGEFYDATITSAQPFELFAVV